MKSFQYGLMSEYVQPQSIHEAHQHNDIELNYLKDGWVTYLYNAHHLTIQRGDFLIFWAAIPHRIVDNSPDAGMYWLTIPLAQVLRWRLSENVTQDLLHGVPVVQAGETYHADLDAHLFQQWHRDIQMASAERETVVLLEVQARLRRMALLAKTSLRGGTYTEINNESAGRYHARMMGQYIAEKYTHPLTIKDIASVVGLNPQYAMTIFRDHFQVTMLAYLAQYRVAHAQRLLLTTDESIRAIARASGFTSISRFYVVFKQLCGQSPKRYRQTVHYPR